MCTYFIKYLNNANQLQTKYYIPSFWKLNGKKKKNELVFGEEYGHICCRAILPTQSSFLIRAFEMYRLVSCTCWFHSFIVKETQCNIYICISTICPSFLSFSFFKLFFRSFILHNIYFTYLSAQWLPLW